MKEKVVSVIIPAYNSASSIEICINSVLNQTFENFEIIVIDDGSTDNTSTILLSYKDKIVHLEQNNQGQGAARNAGLEIACGKFVAFLDSDDYWIPDFLATTVKFLEINPEAVAVNTGYIIKKKGEKIYGPLLSDSDKLIYKGGSIIDDFFYFWGKYDHIRTGTALIRKDTIDKAGFQRADLRISQDLEYWGYIGTFGKWGFIPAPFWVGNPIPSAKKIGWNKKYKKRRKLCPTVEEWEKRIKNRLKENEFVNFKRVRGRVAIGYTHNKILSGNWRNAYSTFLNFSDDMPKNRVFHLMKLGSKLGYWGWVLICMIFKIRESIKG